MKGGLLPLQVFDDRTKSINEILIRNGLHKTDSAQSSRQSRRIFHTWQHPHLRELAAPMD
jgi:hypothetical protein